MSKQNPHEHWTDIFPLSVLVIFWDAAVERLGSAIRAFKRSRMTK